MVGEDSEEMHTGSFCNGSRTRKFIGVVYGHEWLSELLSIFVQSSDVLCLHIPLEQLSLSRAPQETYSYARGIFVATCYLLTRSPDICIIQPARNPLPTCHGRSLYSQRSVCLDSLGYLNLIREYRQHPLSLRSNTRSKPRHVDNFYSQIRLCNVVLTLTSTEIHSISKETEVGTRM